MFPTLQSTRGKPTPGVVNALDGKGLMVQWDWRGKWHRHEAVCLSLALSAEAGRSKSLVKLVKPTLCSVVDLPCFVKPAELLASH